MKKGVLIFTLFLMCTKNKTLEIKHPEENRLPSVNDLSSTASLLEENKEALPFFLFSENISKKNYLRTNLEKKKQFFRVPEKISINVFNEILVLNKSVHKIEVYNGDGIYQYSLGGYGRGPGEFEKIKTFDISQDGDKIYALDAYKVEIFNRQNGIYKYEDTFLHKLNTVYDLCVTEKNIFLSGFSFGKGFEKKIKEVKSFREHMDLMSKVDPNKPILKFGIEDFELKKDFGFIYRSEAGGPNDGILSQTILSCNNLTKTVVGTLSQSSYSFGYSEEGSLKWISKIDGFVPPITTEKIDHNLGHSLTQFDNKTLLNIYYPSRDLDYGEYEAIMIGYSLPQNKIESGPKKIPEKHYYTVLINSNTGELAVTNKAVFWGTASKKKILIIEPDKKDKTTSISINVITK